MKRLFYLFVIFMLHLSVIQAQNISNPVLPRVADAGVMKYNGKYYIGGVHTDGDFYISSDLVNWEGPVHVLSMDNDWTRGTGAGNDQIHANDILYLNGTFHIYWSVNYWGRDRHAVHTTHAESDKVSGPYFEPVTDTWMENRIDPKVFRDDDGKLYMYVVKFTDGNTIWVRPMSDPRSFSGPPIYQFAALPGTWEQMDNKVAEGPWVIKYRNRYYMMYNANHTGGSWGNYQLGVAEADSPILFNNGNKYPYPLLGSNQTLLEEKYYDLLLFNDTYDPEFAYMEQEPSAGWKQLNYTESNDWKKGKGAFASNEVRGSSVTPFGTQWRSEKLFLRKLFHLDKNNTGNLALRINHDGPTKVYLNNALIYESERDYKVIPISESIKKGLLDGTNLLAVETGKGMRSSNFHISLFDMKDEPVDDILFTPGQPNILRGTNGFEWWLIYMANKNREARSQYINRIHFFDKTMYADGVTAENTPGYFPEPAKPTLSRIEEFALNNDTEWLVPSEQKGSSYLLETGINTQGNAGIIAWKQDDNNWIKVGLNKTAHSWYYHASFRSVETRQVYSLPEDFRFDVYHSLRIERNMNLLTVQIDDMPAPGKSTFSVPVIQPSQAGIFSESDKALFAGLIYTLGWDEFDTNVTGWGNAQNGQIMVGEWISSCKGLSVEAYPFAAYKNDFLKSYEFTLQVTNPDDKGTAGVYPIYIDEANYMKVGFNYDKQQLEVTGKAAGKSLKAETFSLKTMQVYYADMKYTDSMEKVFSFHSPSWIDGIWLNRISADNRNQFFDNMFENLIVDYRSEGKWIPAIGEEGIASHKMYNSLTFDKVRTDELRFINKRATDQNPYIYKIQVSELWKQSYNLRSVVLPNELILIVDGKVKARIPHKFGAAQVGVFAEGCLPSFNGILRYERP